jgi:nitroreductase
MHRSIRKYKNTPVEEDQLLRILAAAIRASSSGNMQAYSIIVTTDPALKQELYRPHFEQNMVLDAPVLLTFCADFRRMREWLSASEAPMNFDNYMSFMIAAIDAVLASQNAALAAEAEGLGICYMGTTLASCDEIGAILKCPSQVVPVVGFSLGYPDEDPSPRDRLPLEAIVPEEIVGHYRFKETAGMARYLENPELRGLVQSSGARNLAQVYTRVKYSRESHLKYSKTVLSYLERQGFMQND